MNPKVLATIEQHRMLERGDTVYVAVSGGADSVALLHLLCGLRASLGVTVRALHLNHRLRGAESNRDEAFVRRLCARWRVPLAVESADVARIAARRGLSVEECARGVRYAFFRRRTGEGKVATAHTASDNAETVLINLIRGTALRGLCGIPPVRGNVIRPLLDCTRREVEQYCALHGLCYITDSTNLSDDYTRNKLRHHVLPLLRERNPRLEEGVSRMCAALRTDADYLDAQAARALDGITRGGEYDRTAFLELPDALRPRVLRLLLAGRELPYSAGRLRLMEDCLSRGSGGVQLSPHLLLRCRQDRFLLEGPAPKRHRRPPVPGDSVLLMMPGEEGQVVESGLFSGKKLTFRALDAGKYEKTINKNQKCLKNALDCDRIEKILNLRRARPSDRLRQPGRGCTKTLKKLWSENRVPPGERSQSLLLEDGQGPVWVENFGPHERASVDRGTRRVLLIELKEERGNESGYQTGAHQ